MSSYRSDQIQKLKSPYVRPTLSQAFNGSSSSGIASSSIYRGSIGCQASVSKFNGDLNRIASLGGSLVKEEERDEARALEDSFTVWTVQFRNPQQKKHKTWDNDGVLIVKGERLTLRDDDGKVIANGTLKKAIQPDDELKVGGKDVLIEESSTHEAYYKRFGEPVPASSFSMPSNTAPRYQLPSNVTPIPPIPIAKLIPIARPLPPAPARAPLPSPAPKIQVSKPQTMPLASTLRNAGPSRENSKLEIDAENNPPRKVSRKRDIGLNLDDNYPLPEEENISLASEDGEILPSPKQCQRRRTGSIPRDLSNTDRSIQQEDDNYSMDVETGDAAIVDSLNWKEVEAKRNAKGKGREIVIEAKKVTGVMAKITLTPKVIIPVEVEVQSCYYICLWRKFSINKNSAWEGDGVLIVTGKKAVLKNKETGKEIATSFAAGAVFEPESMVQVGTKTIKIESSFEGEKYLDGSIFLEPQPRAPITVANFYVPIVKLPPKHFIDPIYGGRAGKNKVPAARFPPDAEGAIVMARPSPEHEARYNKKGLPIVDVVIDPILSKVLRPHQAEGIKFMYECVMGMKTEGQGCILADEMGLGKTAQAVALLHTLLRQSPYFGNGTVIERAVIVCPVTLVKNWSAEIKKWLGRDRMNVFIMDDKAKISTFVHSRSFQVMIIGYERLRTVMDDLAGIQPPIGLVICDEGHKLKSSSAKVTVALKQFPTLRRIILSGTPIQNDLSEFHSMVDFVIPGVLDTYSVFKKVFETVILKSREPNATSTDRKVGAARHEQLARVAKNFILRRTADIVKKYLPPKFEFTVFIMPTKLQLALYSQILEGTAVRDLFNGAGAHQLTLLTTLRNLCNTPGLLLKQARGGKGLDILTDSVLSLFPKNADPNDFSLSGKFLVIGSLLEELRRRGEEKIVVVSNFTSTLDIIEGHCRMKRYPFRRLDGGTTTGDRVQMVDEFNRGILKNNFVFLLSSKSGGTGLNIVGASRLVLIDSDWNPSNDVQAMARIHREGQTKPCFIYRFLTAGTVDEKIFQRQVTKLGLSTSLMDDETAMGAGKGDAFTNADLRSIFKLHSDVNCQTHELLGCKCHLSSNFQLDVEEEEDDYDEHLQTLGFTQASQMPEHINPERKDRKNLSLLKEWVHHDCGDESAIDELQDDVLKEVAFLRIAGAPDEEASVLTSATARIPLKGGNIGFAFSKMSE